MPRLLAIREERAQMLLVALSRAGVTLDDTLSRIVSDHIRATVAITDVTVMEAENARMRARAAHKHYFKRRR